MCTISWFVSSQGYSVFFNRDEAKVRPKARPPQILTLNGVSSIMPIDPQGEGTWCFANEYGLTVALLNCEIDKAVDYGERGAKGASDDAVINANLAVAYHFDGQIEKRDEYTAIAKKLNYPSIPDLLDIYSGELLLLPDDCDPNQ